MLCHDSCRSRAVHNIESFPTSRLFFQLASLSSFYLEFLSSSVVRDSVVDPDPDPAYSQNLDDLQFKF